MSPSSSLYVDDNWFFKNMGEDKNKGYMNYPVEVKAMKIRWIILSHYGKDFLTAVLNNENLELYDISTLRIIIEFFYNQYKKYLFYMDVPLFVIKLLLFLTNFWLIQDNILFKKQDAAFELEETDRRKMKSQFYLIEFLLVL
jgi:hypothetical protein